MKTALSKNRIETIGNALALLLGLGFLGDVLELWSFDPFDGWWLLFLYIPAICGFLTKGITAGGILLTLAAVVLTAGMFMEMDVRLWSAALVLYLAYLGVKALRNKWNEADKSEENQEGDSNGV